MLFPAFLCLALFILFITPFFQGIFNFGGFFGAIVSGILSSAFFFWKDTILILNRIWDKPAGRIILSATAVLASAFAVYATIISVLMIRAARNSPTDEDTTLIVLGCKVKQGRPSRMLARRINTAYEFLSEHSEVKAIVSGGKGDDEIISEAQCMKDFLTSKGISTDRIFMEELSANTAQNFALSMKIISENDLCKGITIVTDGFHQLRASMIAKRYGITCRSLSVNTSWWLVPTYWIREWLAIGARIIMKND